MNNNKIKIQKKTGVVIEVGRSIHDRPLSIDNRAEVGHNEVAILLSGDNRSRKCVAIFVDRKSRKLLAIKMMNRTATSMNEALKKAILKMKIKTITVNRSEEFADWREVEKLGVEVYFTDSLSQTGTNKNARGLLREFFPKETNFSKVSEEELEAKVELINNRPRKCLDWKSANEVYYAECCS